MHGQTLVYVFEIGFVVFVVLFVVRFVLAVIRPRTEQPFETDDDDMEGVTVPGKRGPRGRLGAVALSPPDDEQDDTFPPTRM